jgi:hypothetical protein
METLITQSGQGVLHGAAALTSLLFFLVLILMQVIRVLYTRNQKQNDDLVQLVRDTCSALNSTSTTITILSERVQHAFKPEN